MTSTGRERDMPLTLYVRSHDLDEIEAMFRDEQNAAYTGARLLALMEEDGLVLEDVVVGVRELIEPWSYEMAASFLHAVCSPHLPVKASQLCLITRMWSAEQTGHLVHQLVTCGSALAGPVDAAADSLTAGGCLLGARVPDAIETDAHQLQECAAYLQCLFREHTMDYATELLVHLTERCQLEHRGAFWTDERICRLLLLSTAQPPACAATCASAGTAPHMLTSAALPLEAVDLYLFGVVSRLAYYWGVERRATLVCILLDRLLDWSCPHRDTRLAKLIVLFTETWSVAESARLVTQYVRAWQPERRRALFRRLGELWPRHTAVQMFAVLLGMLFPPSEPALQARWSPPPLLSAAAPATQQQSFSHARLGFTPPASAPGGVGEPGTIGFAGHSPPLSLPPVTASHSQPLPVLSFGFTEVDSCSTAAHGGAVLRGASPAHRTGKRVSAAAAAAAAVAAPASAAMLTAAAVDSGSPVIAPFSTGGCDSAQSAPARLRSGSSSPLLLSVRVPEPSSDRADTSTGSGCDLPCLLLSSPSMSMHISSNSSSSNHSSNDSTSSSGAGAADTIPTAAGFRPAGVSSTAGRRLALAELVLPSAEARMRALLREGAAGAQAVSPLAVSNESLAGNWTGGGTGSGIVPRSFGAALRPALPQTPAAAAAASMASPVGSCRLPTGAVVVTGQFPSAAEQHDRARRAEREALVQVVSVTWSRERRALLQSLVQD